MTLRAVGAITAVLLALLVSAAPAGAQDQPITWWALGDSYSSGEGISGTERPSGGKPECARASGHNTGAKAWAVLARETLAEPRISSWAFTPCTGAISSDVEGQMNEAAAASAHASADIVTLSMGGNDILFGDVVRSCIDLEVSWSSISPGCNVGEATLRRRIEMLVGATPAEEGQYTGITLPTLYDDIAARVRSGGAVVVLGYPQIIEEVSRWDGWRRNVIANCEGVQSYDVGMLRSVAGYLNEQIAFAVQAADRRWSPKGIRFYWRDIASGVYETGDDPAQRHALCTEDPWLNGTSVGVTSGDWRYQRSFHPMQVGHRATGTWLSNWMRTDIGLDQMARPQELTSPSWDQLKNAAIPEMCTHPPTTLVDGKDVSLTPFQGYFELLRTLPNGQPGLVQGVPSDAGPLTAVVVSCNAGGVGWPDQVMFFKGQGEYHAHIDLYEGVDWEAAGMYAPGRNGIEGVWVRGAELEVYTTAELYNDMACCPSSAALLRMRAEGDGVRITSLEEDIGD